MGRVDVKRLIILLGLLIMIIWPLTQLFGWLFPNEEKQDPIKMLYQVSFFQIEMLNGYLLEASSARSTEELNMLRQVVYSAGFTHERLVLAVGSKQLSSLPSLNELLQYVLRLQNSGQRQLREAEVQTIERLGTVYQELYEAYGSLLSNRHKMVSAQNKSLSKADQRLLDILKDS